MIEKTLTISTAHISSATNEALGISAFRNKFPFRFINDHDYGYIFFLSGDKDYSEEIAEFPELEKMIKYAKENGCSMINLDRDAEVIKDLKKFDW